MGKGVIGASMHLTRLRKPPTCSQHRWKRTPWGKECTACGELQQKKRTPQVNPIKMSLINENERLRVKQDRIRNRG